LGIESDPGADSDSDFETLGARGNSAESVSSEERVSRKSHRVGGDINLSNYSPDDEYVEDLYPALNVEKAGELTKDNSAENETEKGHHHHSIRFHHTPVARDITNTMRQRKQRIRELHTPYLVCIFSHNHAFGSLLLFLRTTIRTS
jgi:hypothetical protein